MAEIDFPIPDDPPLTRTEQWVVIDFGQGEMPVTVGPWRTQKEAQAWSDAYAIDPLNSYAPTAIIAGWNRRTVLPLWHPVHWCEQTGS